MGEDNNIKANTYTNQNPDPTKGQGPSQIRYKARKQQEPINFEALKQRRLYENLSSGRNYTLPNQVSDRQQLFGSKDLGVLSTISGYNNAQDIWAQQQSTSTKWANGLGKFLVNTGATFIDDVVGTLYGLGQGIAEMLWGNNEKLNWWARFQHGYVNNHVTALMQDWRDWSQDVMTNYQTKAEQEADWWDRFWTANFWSDQILTNAGFTAGTLLGMWAQGAVGGYMGKYLTKYNKNPFVRTDKKFLESISQQAYNNMIGVNETASGISGTKKLFFGQKWSDLRHAFYGGVAEGRMEGYTNAKDWRDRENTNLDEDTNKRVDNARQAFFLQHQYDPEYYTYYQDDIGNLTPVPTEKALNEFNEVLKEIQHKRIETAKKIDDSAARMGGEIALANSVFLTIDNALNLTRVTNFFRKGATDIGKFVKGSTKTQKFIQKEAEALAKKEGITLKQATDIINDRLYLQPSFWATPKGGLIKGLLQGPLVESNEEMFQAFISEAAGLRRGAALNGFYKSVLDDETPEFLADGLAFVGQAIDNTYGNPKRWEEGVVGAITGLLGTASMPNAIYNKKTGRKSKWYDYLPWQSEVLNEWAEAKEKNSQLQEWEKIARAAVFEDPKKQQELANLMRTLSFQKKANASQILQDEESYEDNLVSSLLSQATSAAELGVWDEFIAKIDQAFPSVETDEDAKTFKDLFRDEDGNSQFDEYTTEQISELVNDKRDKAIKTLQTYKNVRDQILDYFNTTDQAYISELAYNATMINLWRDNINELIDYTEGDEIPAKVKLQSVIKSLTDEQREQYFDGLGHQQILELAKNDPAQFLLKLTKDRNIIKNLTEYKDLKTYFTYITSRINELKKRPKEEVKDKLKELNKLKGYLNKELKKRENLNFIWSKYIVEEGDRLGSKSNYSAGSLLYDIANLAVLTNKIQSAEAQFSKIANNYAEFEKIKKETSDLWAEMQVSNIADAYLDRVDDEVDLLVVMRKLEGDDKLKEISRNAIQKRLESNKEDKQLWDNYQNLLRLKNIVEQASQEREDEKIDAEDDAETKTKKNGLFNARKRLKEKIDDVLEKEWEGGEAVEDNIERKRIQSLKRSADKKNYHRNTDNVLRLLEESKNGLDSLTPNIAEAYINLVDQIIDLYKTDKSNYESIAETKAKTKEDKSEESKEEEKAKQEPTPTPTTSVDVEIDVDSTLSEDEKQDNNDQSKASNIIGDTATSKESQNPETNQFMEDSDYFKSPSVERTTGYKVPPYDVEQLKPDPTTGQKHLIPNNDETAKAFREIISPVLDSGIVGIIHEQNKSKGEDTTVNLIMTNAKTINGIAVNENAQKNIIWLGIKIGHDEFNSIIESNRDKIGDVNLQNKLVSINGETYLLVGMLGGISDGRNNPIVDSIHNKIYATFQSMISDDNETWYVSDIINKIQKVYSGRIANSDNSHPIELNGKKPVLAVYLGGEWKVYGDDEGVIVNSTTFTPAVGSVWYLTTGADGKLYYKATIPQRLNSAWLSSHNSDTNPIIKDIKEQLGILLDSNAPTIERARAKYALKKLLFFDRADIHFMQKQRDDGTTYVEVWVSQESTSKIIKGTINAPISTDVDEALEQLAAFNFRFTINIKIDNSKDKETAAKYAEKIIDSEILNTDLIDGHYNASIELYNWQNANGDLSSEPSVPLPEGGSKPKLTPFTVATDNRIIIEESKLLDENKFIYTEKDTGDSIEVNLTTKIVYRNNGVVPELSEEYSKAFNRALVFLAENQVTNYALGGNLVYQVTAGAETYYVKTDGTNVWGIREQDALAAEYERQNTPVESKMETISESEVLAALRERGIGLPKVVDDSIEAGSTDGLVEVNPVPLNKEGLVDVDALFNSEDKQGLKNYSEVVGKAIESIEEDIYNEKLLDTTDAGTKGEVIDAFDYMKEIINEHVNISEVLSDEGDRELIQNMFILAQKYNREESKKDIEDYLLSALTDDGCRK